jgi:hypothetical protein
LDNYSNYDILFFKNQTIKFIKISIMKIRLQTTLFFLLLSTAHLFSQSMIDSIGDDEIDYVKYAFKTNRVINMHSTENTAQGVMDFKISHRFGSIANGAYDLFGLDNATQRIGLDYGVTENLQVGLNRNSVGKAYDAYGKYRLLRQSTGKKEMPITLSAFASIADETIDFADQNRINYYSSRLNYTFQLIIGKKFNDFFSLELVPSLVHRNLVPTATDKNNVYAIGTGARFRLSRRMTFNAEYIYILPNQLGPEYYNSLSVGLDIETGGHVFQLHFTNSTSMAEYGFITRTNESWANKGIHFGFNVSRVFTIWDPKKKASAQ